MALERIEYSVRRSIPRSFLFRPSIHFLIAGRWFQLVNVKIKWMRGTS